MRPTQWDPSIELSASEQAIVKRIRRAKLFIFLREHRHEVFDAALQEELASLYQDSPRGQPPVAPALLALATILQAYTGASDDEVIEASVMDRRWQLVLDCLDTQEAPFSKGTLIAFRQRLIEANMDRRLIERTLEVARQAGAFGAGPLRAALTAKSSGPELDKLIPLIEMAARLGIHGVLSCKDRVKAFLARYGAAVRNG